MKTRKRSSFLQTFLLFFVLMVPVKIFLSRHTLALPPSLPWWTPFGLVAAWALEAFLPAALLHLMFRWLGDCLRRDAGSESEPRHHSSEEHTVTSFVDGDGRSPL